MHINNKPISLSIIGGYSSNRKAPDFYPQSLAVLRSLMDSNEPFTAKGESKQMWDAFIIQRFKDGTGKVTLSQFMDKDEELIEECYKYIQYPKLLKKLENEKIFCTKLNDEFIEKVLDRMYSYDIDSEANDTIFLYKNFTIVDVLIVLEDLEKLTSKILKRQYRVLTKIIKDCMGNSPENSQYSFENEEETACGYN